MFGSLKQVFETGEIYDWGSYYDQDNLTGSFQHSIVKLGDSLCVTTKNISKVEISKGEIARLKDEIALKATDKYFTVVNNMDQGFCIIEVIFDLEGKATDYRFLEINPLFEKQTGLKNAVGKTIRELQPAHEDHWFEIYGKVAKTGKSIHFENEAAHLLDGVWYDVFAVPFDKPAKNRVAIFFDDITERKKNERRQNYVLKISEVIRSIGDPELIEDTVTSIAMEYFGADRCYYCRIDGGDAVISRDAASGDLPSVQGTYPLSDFKLFKEIVDQGRPFIVEDVRSGNLLDSRLKELCLQLKIISFINIPVVKNEKVVGILCLVQSSPRIWKAAEKELVTETAERIWAAVERARALEDLQRSEEQLQKLLGQRDEFIAAASHELKTPVTSIKAYAQILEKQIKEKGGIANFQIVASLSKQIGRLTALINHLLDVTRIAEGKLSMNFGSTDINELLQERATEIGATSHHQFIFNLTPVPLVNIDRERIG
ncbi:GAF domain-containing sensor histidine kinase [Niabella aquatica]